MQIIDTSLFPTLLSFVLIAELLTEKIFKPVRDLPWSDHVIIWVDLVTPYVAWVISLLLCWFGQVNLFGTLFSPTVGILLTGFLSGLSANRLHDLMSGESLARHEAVYRALESALEED